MALLLAKRAQEIRFIEEPLTSIRRLGLPAEKMKIRKEHRQPITEPIIQMLQRMKSSEAIRGILENGGKPLRECNAGVVKRFDKITVLVLEQLAERGANKTVLRGNIKIYQGISLIILTQPIRDPIC